MCDPRAEAGRSCRAFAIDRRRGLDGRDLRCHRQAKVQLSDPVLRPAARVVVLDPRGCVLLQRFRRDDGVDIWITPGGAIEDGESALDAARRELFEEAGVEAAELFGPVWTRRHVFRWAGNHFDQRESFFVARLTERVEAAPTLAADVIAAEGIEESRWWAIDELEAAGVELAPRSLVTLLRDLAANGIPAEPIDAGV